MNEIADVNWLLSALTQATAALIAIVGGLLVSRYVALHAEQQAAHRRVQDLARREDEAKDALAAAHTDLGAYYINDALDDDRVFAEILSQNLKPTVQGVLDAIDYDDDDLNADLLATEIEAMSREMAAAIGTLSELVPAGEAHEDWTDFRRRHGVEVGHRNLWEWVYDRLCEERQREAAAEVRRSNPIAASLVSSYLICGLIPPTHSAAQRMIRSQQELAQIRTLEERKDNAEAELRALAQERRLAEETYEATRQPEGFTLALQVLTFLAVVGMGPPVVLMGFAPMNLPGWMRTGVIALFGAGIALLLRFLFVYAAFLREGGRDMLPRNVFGLLRRG